MSGAGWGSVRGGVRQCPGQHNKASSRYHSHLPIRRCYNPRRVVLVLVAVRVLPVSLMGCRPWSRSVSPAPPPTPFTQPWHFPLTLTSPHRDARVTYAGPETLVEIPVSISGGKRRSNTISGFTFTELLRLWTSYTFAQVIF